VCQVTIYTVVQNFISLSAAAHDLARYQEKPTSWCWKRYRGRFQDQLSLPSLQGRWIKYKSLWLGL